MFDFFEDELREKVQEDTEKELLEKLEKKPMSPMDREGELHAEMEGLILSGELKNITAYEMVAEIMHTTHAQELGDSWFVKPEYYNDLVPSSDVVVDLFQTLGDEKAHDTLCQIGILTPMDER